MKTEEMIQDKIELYKKSMRECLDIWNLEKAGRFNERLTALEWVLEDQMNEVEKMYRNAGVEPLCQIPDEYCGMKNVYEDFTAEKQIELIKWLGELQIDTRKGYWHLAKFGRITKTIYADNGNLGEALSGIINQLWQDLTDAERTQIKEILE